MSEPVMVRGSGPHLVQRWVLEVDATRYEAIVVFNVEGSPMNNGSDAALVCVNVAGGGERMGPRALSREARFPRWMDEHFYLLPYKECSND